MVEPSVSPSAPPSPAGDNDRLEVSKRASTNRRAAAAATLFSEMKNHNCCLATIHQLLKCGLGIDVLQGEMDIRWISSCEYILFYSSSAVN